MKKAEQPSAVLVTIETDAQLIKRIQLKCLFYNSPGTFEAIKQLCLSHLQDHGGSISTFTSCLVSLFREVGLGGPEI